MKGVLTTAALLLLLASTAHAWTPIASSRPTWSGPAPYSLHEAGSVDLGGYDATLTIVRQGMDDWTRVSCSALHTSFEGSTSSVPFRSGSNVVGWIESSWIDDPNAIGITGPSWGGSGAIVDAQMAMNGVNFTWTTDPGSGSRVNAYSITLHEAGHYYGLGHSSDGSATMYYAYSGGVSNLNSDDETGICALYPGGGGGTSPDGGTEPDPGPEPDPGGTAMFCEACTSDASCAGAGTRCLRYPDGALYCGQTCGSDAECDNGTCEMISDGSRQCIRRDTSGSPNCAAAPAPDPGPEPDPDGGVDPRPPEDTCGSDADCGPTEVCDTDAGVCVTRPGAGLGDPCTTNDMCTSGLCAIDDGAGDSFCTQLCDAATPCPSGFECASVEGGSSACRPTMAGLGEACTGPGDCLSNMCAESANGRFCTRTCGSAMACPAGFECLATEGGGTSVCVEGAGGGSLGPGGATSMGLVGGCSAAPGRAPTPAAWLLALSLAVLAARRRR